MPDRPSKHPTSLGPKAEAPPDRPKRTRRQQPAEEAAVRRFAVETARLLSDSHCEDVLMLDVRELSDLTDYILIASGTSDRQIRSVADDVVDLAKQTGMGKLGREVDGPANWLVLDFVDVVIHLFEPITRAHYDLEMLWGDAAQVNWRREAPGKSEG
ncbi:MAG: ribosome silencing factor [Phycisphaeraceae bacterium]|nr:ribosome silencing factor [Phycisphaeraceae bacterium]